MQAKRARQQRERERVVSGQYTLKSMFLISPEIVHTLALNRRTDDL